MGEPLRLTIDDLTTAVTHYRERIAKLEEALRKIADADDSQEPDADVLIGIARVALGRYPDLFGMGADWYVRQELGGVCPGHVWRMNSTGEWRLCRLCGKTEAVEP